MIKVLAVALVSILLAGCVNPYAQFYKGASDIRTTRFYDPSPGEEVKVVPTNDFTRDRYALFRQGYIPIGQATFNMAINAVTERQIVDQAKKVGAHVVLVASQYTHTVQGAMPLFIPQTSTSYSSGSATAYGPSGTAYAYGSGTTTTYSTQAMMMPYSVQRGDFAAMFFAKTRPRVGLLVEEVDAATHKRLKANAGVRVVAIVEGSPAFAANVLPGDILLSVNGELASSIQSYQNSLDRYEGKAATFLFDRDGESVEKEITILTVPSHNAK